MAFEARFVHGNPLMVDYTPGSAVPAGTVVVTSDTPRIAHLDIPANTLGALAAGGGVYEMAGDAAIAADKKVYWNNTANKVTETSSGNKVIGVTVTACSADGDVCQVRHDPSAYPPPVRAPAPHEAAMGLLNRANAWLTRTMPTAAAPAGPVTYVRGDTRIDLTGVTWVGRTVFNRAPSEGGAAIVWGDRDYLIPVSALPWPPEKGDRVEEVIGGVTALFDVLPPDNEPPWRYSDESRTAYRVHCQDAGTA